MSKPRYVPVRQCMGCREHKPKAELIRVVRSPAGEVSLDATGRKPGRGVYLCQDPACRKRVAKSRALERALAAPIPAEVQQTLDVLAGTAKA
ncbi:MAG: YlxR family protein [Oscillospiraceae bacterium]|nr:YlxR family protein [Oscillospiraceae bacterium]